MCVPFLEGQCSHFFLSCCMYPSTHRIHTSLGLNLCNNMYGGRCSRKLTCRRYQEPFISTSAFSFFQDQSHKQAVQTVCSRHYLFSCISSLISSLAQKSIAASGTSCIITRNRVMLIHSNKVWVPTLIFLLPLVIQGSKQ